MLDKKRKETIDKAIDDILHDLFLKEKQVYSFNLDKQRQIEKFRQEMYEVEDDEDLIFEMSLFKAEILGD